MSDMKTGADLEWIKSSYSGNDQDKTNCVEVAFDPDGQGAYVRDSKAPEAGVFHLQPASWRGLLAAASKIEIPPTE
jgi:uncharacterized protein DUF397